MSKEIRLDLHTHSIISYDGGITDSQYRQLLASETLCLAITDHNEISFAKEFQSKFGPRVIVGEEILTTEGEIIGLFLTEKIEKGFNVKQVIAKIREQGGLVYVPHPFEKSRNGLSLEVMQEISNSIDIVEVYNARNREPWLSRQAQEFADEHNLAKAASSDAHGIMGLGTAYSAISELPSRENLVRLLKSADLKKTHAPLWSLLDPFRNKLRKKLS